MNSRERMVTTLQHREPDRVPIDLGGTDVTSICAGAYKELMAHLGRDPGPIVIENMVEQLPRLPEAFLRDFARSDVRQIRQRPGSTWRLVMQEDEHYWRFTDEWSIGMRMPKEDGHYFDMVDPPLKEPTHETLAAFSWPDPRDPARWAGVEEEATRLFNTSDIALITGCLFGGGTFQFPHYLRGMADFLTDLIWYPKFAEELMDRITDTLIAGFSQMLDRVGPYVQVVRLCDDLATQHAPMISPDMYRRLIKPRHKRLIEVVKARTDAHIMLHSDGAMRAFLPDLIEIGIDILNPVQVSADGMDDTAALKREFGKDLSFWGGICDSQHVLPFGTPAQVRDETKRRLDDLMPGGGFVAAPIHNIQDGVPPENIVALFETLHEHGVY